MNYEMNQQLDYNIIQEVEQRLSAEKKVALWIEVADII